MRLFDACRCVEDVNRVKLDPTGTAALRKRFNTMINMHWRRARIMVRNAVMTQNILGLTSGPSIAAPAALGGASTIQIFQRWIDSVLGNTVLEGEGSYIRQYIKAGYDAGIKHAERELGQRIVVTQDIDRVATLSTLAYVELQGIVEAVSQQVVRVVANSLLTKKPAAKVVKRIQAVIDSVGVSRSTAMVELLVVKAFGEATLDAYDAVGIAKVGLVTEKIAGRRMSDARRLRTGPGSRIPRNRTPSPSTIRRIRRVERNFEKIGKVNVETAEDDKVCQVCEDIAADGPYTINDARSLIPAHPRCRCIFVPVLPGDDDDKE